MEGTVRVESSKPRSLPKVLKSMTIEPRLGGGHVITHHYTSYQHEPKTHEFDDDEGEKAMAHIAKHAGLPHKSIEEHDADRPDPITKDEEEL